MLDASEEQEEAVGPSYATETEEETPAKKNKKPGLVQSGIGVISGFLAPAPKKGAVPKTPQQRKRAIEDGKRKQRTSLRYRGDRRKWWTINIAAVTFAVISVMALMIAMSRPTNDDVAAQVQEQLAESGRDFPQGEAVMWAGQVLRVWGTWDEANEGARKVLLAPYLSSGMDQHAGWNGKGQQEVLYASINPEPRVTDSNHATVSAVYQIGDGSWRCVDLPIFAYKADDQNENSPWAFALAGNPTPVACSPRTGAPNLTGEEIPEDYVADSDLGRSLSVDFFPGFFAAWAASDTQTLAQYTAPGVRALGLGGAMASVPPPSISDVSVFVPRDGAVDNQVYTAVVGVTWTLSGSTSQVESVYEVQIRKNGDRWYVMDEPVASSQYPEVSGGNPAEVPEPGENSGEQTYPNPTPNPSEPPESTEPNSEEGGTPPSDEEEESSPPDSEEDGG